MAKKWGSLIVLTFLFLHNVFAISTKATAESTSELKAPAITFKILTDVTMAPLLKQAAERAKRRAVASDQLIDPTKMSKEYTSFRDRFINAKSPDDVAREVAFLEKGYSDFPLDLQYFAAQMIPIKAFRGIVYRMVPLAEKENITHSALLTTVQGFVEQMGIYIPKDHAKALLDYLLSPYVTEDNSIVTQIKSSADLQRYVAQEVIPMTSNAIFRLQEIQIGNNDVIWDNTIIYGNTAFLDDIRRYRIIADVDRYAAIAHLHSALAHLCFLDAYNLDRLSELLKDEGKLVGLDGFLAKKIEGATSLDRAEVMQKERYEKLFVTTNYANTKEWMALSFTNLEQSIRNIRLVWNETKNRPAEEFAILDSTKVIPWEKDIEINLSIAEVIMEGKAQIRSAVSGERLTINLPGFFENPPKDLKKLLPIVPANWKKTDRYAYLKLPPNVKNPNNRSYDDLEGNPGTNKKDFQYRNYYHGQAKEWNLDAYKTLFPELASGKDIKKAVRILSETWNSSQVTAISFMQ